jgi:nitrate/TMAO reductase-like tetraheme cytochrome c subunit
VSKLAKLFRGIGSFIKGHPFISLLIFIAALIACTGITYELMHYTSSPEFCRKCHPNEGVGPLAEYHTWSNNVHAANGVECIDCHSSSPGAWGYMKAKMGGLYDLFAELFISKEAKLAKLSRFEGNPKESAALVGQNVCLHCHSDKVNIDNRKAHVMSFAGVAMRQIDRVVNPEFRNIFGLRDIITERSSYTSDPNHSLHVVENGALCADCHIKVSHSGSYYSNIDMQTCFDCHEIKRSEGKKPAENDNCVICHATQVSVQAGVAAQSFGVEDVVWEMASNDCMDCHENAFDRPSRESCENCHEEGYAELKDMFQENFDEQLVKADAFWSSHLKDRRQLTRSKREIFNSYEQLLNILKNDGSRGIHNSGYTDKIFEHLAVLEEEFTDGGESVGEGSETPE